MFEFIEKMEPNAVIKVIGVGGGGGNAVSHMVNAQASISSAPIPMPRR